MTTTQATPGHDERTVRVERAVAFGLLAVVGGYAFVTSLEYGWFADQGRVGPGLVPGVIGGLVAVLSLAMVVATLRGAKSTEEHGLAEVAAAATARPSDAESSGVDDEADDDVDIFGRTARQRVHQLWMVTAGLVVALSLVGYIGLLAAFLLFCLFASIVVERRPWLTALVVTAISIAAVYYLFAVFLEVPLPTGYLGFGG